MGPMCTDALQEPELLEWARKDPELVELVEGTRQERAASGRVSSTECRNGRNLSSGFDFLWQTTCSKVPGCQITLDQVCGMIMLQHLNMSNPGTGAPARTGPRSVAC